MIEQIYAYFTIEILYFWVNLGVLPFWLILIFFPQSNLCKYFVTSIFPILLLSGTYIFVLYKSYLSTYDFQISSSAINKKLFNEIKELEPFGAGNLLPTFFIKDLKIIKKLVIKNKHISAILKPKQGTSIKSICFNSLNTKIGEYLLSYKKSINVIGQIYENDWNNKKNIQLIINDILL